MRCIESYGIIDIESVSIDSMFIDDSGISCMIQGKRYIRVIHNAIQLTKIIVGSLVIRTRYNVNIVQCEIGFANIICDRLDIVDSRSWAIHASVNYFRGSEGYIGTGYLTASSVSIIIMRIYQLRIVAIYSYISSSAMYDCTILTYERAIEPSSIAIAYPTHIQTRNIKSVGRYILMKYLRLKIYNVNIRKNFSISESYVSNLRLSSYRRVLYWIEP